MDQELQQKIESLPEDIKTAIRSEETGNTLKKIGMKYGLHIDQIGILQQVTLGVMLGDIHPDEYIEKLEENIDIDEEDAVDLATEVNVEVLIPLRESIMRVRGEETDQDIQGSTASFPSHDVNPAKEDILAEIENPSPTIHPISAADQTIAGPARASEIIEPTPVPNTKPVNAIAAKLEGSVNTPTIKVAETSKSYAADPYREPIS